MSDRIIQFATYVWLAAIALCIFGFVKIFGPISIGLLGIILAAEKSEKIDHTPLVILSLMTAVAIFIGVQQHEKKLGQIAYWAHRQSIGCKDADRWEAMGGGKNYPYPKPRDADIVRCSELEDSMEFEHLLGANGW